MRFAERSAIALALAVLGAARAATFAPSDVPTLVHAARYSMGTMFDIVAYHASPQDARRAIDDALAEIVRLDQVMSHYKSDSDLARLNREGARGFMSVEPSLYAVIDQSIAFSRLSGGTFDVTIAPLLRTWKKAHNEGRVPVRDEIAAAKRCVGYQNIEARPPNEIRFRSDCVELDLGGIGKGFAVDRAIEILRAAGIRHALVNGGASSIAAIGAPPGQRGWPVQLEASVSGRDILLLRDASMSTSEQRRVPLPFAQGSFGEILDPRSGAPAESSMVVSVIAPGATAADALSTTLLMLPIERGKKLLEQFADVSALWMSPDGELHAALRKSRLDLESP